jgi:hypothetical protein
MAATGPGRSTVIERGGLVLLTRRGAAVVAPVLALALVAPAAHAEIACLPGAGADVGARPGELDPERRLAWIDSELGRSAHRARLWTWGWGIGLGVGTLANLAPLPFVKADQRIDWYTGAVTTAIGIVPLVIAPLDVVADAHDLHARIAARGATDVCTLLGDAETRLVRDAKNQADGQRWWLHVGNVVLNTGVGLFLIVGYRHWAAGAFNAIVGSAIGEVLILTQPTGAIESLRRYREGTF